MSPMPDTVSASITMYRNEGEAVPDSNFVKLGKFYLSSMKMINVNNNVSYID
jgi:hypothetical protein